MGHVVAGRPSRSWVSGRCEIDTAGPEHDREQDERRRGAEIGPASAQHPAQVLALDRAVLGWLSYGREIWLSGALSLVCALIALLVVADLVPRVALGAATALNLVFWVVCRQ